MAFQVLKIGKSIILRKPGYVVTVMGDRALEATPQDTSEYEERARQLGYESGEEMNAEHDPMHALVSDWLSERYCPVLYAAAAGEVFPWAAARERLVLDFQRYLNTGEATDLIQHQSAMAQYPADVLRKSALRLLRSWRCGGC